MIKIRPWMMTDLDDLVEQANNIQIWNNVRNYFPHPYLRSDGIDWIERSLAVDPPTSLCIDFEKKTIGGIGIIRQGDVHYKTAELGYWIGETYWGKGFATDAVRQMTRYCFDQFDIIRLYAEIFETNKASCRVLEKSGFQFESVKQKSVIKNGEVMNSLVYVKLRDENGHK